LHKAVSTHAIANGSVMPMRGKLIQLEWNEAHTEWLGHADAR
jgi:hypothetical protein